MPEPTELATETPLGRPHEGWPAKPFLQADPSITVVFHGLLSFCYNRTRKDCEVGVFSNQIASNHRLRIEICRDGEASQVIWGHQLSSGDLSLEVLGVAAGVSAYEKAGSFNRLDDSGSDDRDFRWMLDIEGPDFYNKVISKKYPGYYQPKLFVKDGVFYTLEKTGSKFIRVSAHEPSDPSKWQELGSMAYCLAANIYMSSGQTAKLFLPGPGNSFFNHGERTHKIFFTNICYDNVSEKCKRSDFFQHFHSFDPPDGIGRYELQLVTPAPEGTRHECGGLASEHQKDILTTDEAPCGGAGYGGSSSHP